MLALKGLARDWKQEVGERALTGLLEVLYNDAELDADIGKAVLETLNLLCDVEDTPELGYKHSDAVLATERTVHCLLTLLADNTFYVRFATLQYLSTLLQSRRQVVQGYFLTASSGPTSVVAVLEDQREIIRNGACPVDRGGRRKLIEYLTQRRSALFRPSSLQVLIYRRSSHSRVSSKNSSTSFDKKVA